MSTLSSNEVAEYNRDASQKKPQVSAEVAAYNEAWRIYREIFRSALDPSTVGANPEYIENRLLRAFESGWNGAMNWVESRTLKEIKNDR